MRPFGDRSSGKKGQMVKGEERDRNKREKLNRKNNRTYANPTVPKCNVILAPLESHLQLLRRGNELVQIGHDGIALCLRDADDLRNEARVVIEGFPTCDGMGADEWVGGDGRFTTNGASGSNGVVGLHPSRVKCGEGGEICLHRCGKEVVGGVLRRPESVPAGAGGWTGE